MVNEISEITRRNIWEGININGIDPFGRLEVPAFLGRIFNLAALPSTDGRYKDAYRDIYQHTVLNPGDWDDYWLLSDKRINLLFCDDLIFLQVLCETLHPVVRADPTETTKLLQLYNEYLAVDGYQIIEKARISDRPIFAGIKRGVPDIIKKKDEEIKKRLTAEYVTQQITLMESTIEISPHVAIGTAKELIETCCKSIFDERGVRYEKDWELPKLVKETIKLLKLAPEDIPDKTKASNSIKQILVNLSAVVQGICELRNEYGSGHGKGSSFMGLDSRHAKLAVGSASILAIFLLETHEIQ
ncbi:MAG: abortive infection family protein [Thermoplasmata archaeon]|nr:abortive infection family protein [Thermoplasmata archaeon]MBE3139646.1 abortive infection family protein [Thermoplasmata archaeon]